MIPFEHNSPRWPGGDREGPGSGAFGGPLGDRFESLRAAQGGGDGRAPRLSPRGAWLLPPLLLGAIAAGAVFVFAGPGRIFGLVLGVVFALGFLWILVSVLFPAKADRTCPQCGEQALSRIDPGATYGLYCRCCSWRDETASAFMHAEEEGSLEDIVLRERRGGDSRRL